MVRTSEHYRAYGRVPVHMTYLVTTVPQMIREAWEKSPFGGTQCRGMRFSPLASVMREVMVHLYSETTGGRPERIRFRVPSTRADQHFSHLVAFVFTQISTFVVLFQSIGM